MTDITRPAPRSSSANRALARLFPLAALLALPACKASTETPAASSTSAPAAAPAAQAPGAPTAAAAEPAPKPPSDEACAPEKVKTMKPFMECLIAPWPTMGRGDEQTFKKALEELKGMVPDARYAQAGDPNNWISIIEKMQATGEYKVGCKLCHNAWRRDYKNRYHDVQVR